MPRTASDRLRSAPLIVAALAALVVIGYSAYAAYPYLRGPILTLDAPRQVGLDMVLSGRTVRVSTLSVNGLPTPLDERGFFSLERAYPPGYTVVTVRVVDRFGRSVTRTLTFVTKPYASEKTESGTGTSTGQVTSTGSHQ
jgi:hypothetical protein